MTTECMGRIGLSLAAVFALTLVIGCESHRNTRPSSQPPPSQAGSPGQQGSMSGQSPMEHDTGSERMIK
jgi:hypothetical protein